MVFSRSDIIASRRQDGAATCRCAERVRGGPAAAARQINYSRRPSDGRRQEIDDGATSVEPQSTQKKKKKIESETRASHLYEKPRRRRRNRIS